MPSRSLQEWNGARATRLEEIENSHRMVGGSGPGRRYANWRLLENWRLIMGSTKRRYSKEEFARRGDAIYENDVRPRLKPADEGKFAAIDIESGVYEIDRDELKAGNRLRARIPEAQIWMVRVGHRSVHRIGGRERRETR